MTNRLHADPPVALQFMHTRTKPMQQHDSAWEMTLKGTQSHWGVQAALLVINNIGGVQWLPIHKTLVILCHFIKYETSLTKVVIILGGCATLVA